MNIKVIIVTIFISLIFILSCRDPIKKPNEIIKPYFAFKLPPVQKKDTSQNKNLVYQIEKGKVFIVKDSSKYSSEFINDLRRLSSDFDTIVLINDTIIIKSRPFNGHSYIESVDTVSIPTIPPLNKRLKYKKVVENKKYELSIERINYSNVEYNFRINDSLYNSGQLVLPAGFILGDEFDEDEEGMAIPVIQYIDKSKCWTIIRIDADTQEYLRIQVICWHNSKDSFDINRLKKE
jgi:hypothetical protein